MKEVVCNVKDIDSMDRDAVEHLIGQRLREDQQLVIRVVNRVVAAANEQPTPQGTSADHSLPEWCHVYEGLSADEIASLERIVLRRADLTRAVE